MPIDPIRIAEDITGRFRRYLATTFSMPEAYEGLNVQFRDALGRPGRLAQGPYLHGLAPYVRGASLADLVRDGTLPAAIRGLPFLDVPERPLYRHQVTAITRLRRSRNVVVSTGTGSGKTLTFLIPILAGILERPEEG